MISGHQERYQEEKEEVKEALDRDREKEEKVVNTLSRSVHPQDFTHLVNRTLSNIIKILLTCNRNLLVASSQAHNTWLSLIVLHNNGSQDFVSSKSPGIRSILTDLGQAVPAQSS